MEAWSGLPAGERLSDEDVDRDPVLGVHHHGGRRISGLLHGFKDFPVGRVEDPGVSHEELEARHPLADELVHFLARLLVNVRNDHVEPVVDRAVAFGFLMPRVEP